MSVQASITFVPSVHFSPTHRRYVCETIRAEAPDVVAVELDEFRFEHLDRDRGPTSADVARAFPSTPAAATYDVITEKQEKAHDFSPGWMSKLRSARGSEWASALDCMSGVWLMGII